MIIEGTTIASGHVISLYDLITSISYTGNGDSLATCYSLDGSNDTRMQYKYLFECDSDELKYNEKNGRVEKMEFNMVDAPAYIENGNQDYYWNSAWDEILRLRR